MINQESSALGSIETIADGRQVGAKELELLVRGGRKAVKFENHLLGPTNSTLHGWRENPRRRGESRLWLRLAVPILKISIPKKTAL